MQQTLQGMPEGDYKNYLLDIESFIERLKSYSAHEVASLLTLALQDNRLNIGMICLIKVFLQNALKADIGVHQVSIADDFLLEEAISELSETVPQLDEFILLYLANVLNVELRVIDFSAPKTRRLAKYNIGCEELMYLYGSNSYYKPLQTKKDYLAMHYPPSAVEDYQAFLKDLDGSGKTENKDKQIDILRNDLKKCKKENEELKEESGCFGIASELFLGLVYKMERHITDYESLQLINEQLTQVASIKSSSVEYLGQLLKSKKCSYCANLADLVELSCGDKICHTDMFDHIRKGTRELMVLNEFEKRMKIAKEPVCPVCSKLFDNESVLESILGTAEFSKFEAAAAERLKKQMPKTKECALCRMDLLEEKDYFNVDVCKDYCKHCVIESIRRGDHQCPVCAYSYEEIRKRIEGISLKCVGCRETKNSIRYFSNPNLFSDAFCVAHDMLCTVCLSKVCKWKQCFLCINDMHLEQITEARKCLSLKCVNCETEFSRTEPLVAKPCICPICPACQLKDTATCIRCHTEFPADITSYLGEEKRKEDERQRRINPECLICWDAHPISETRCLPCGHYFGEECLKMKLSEDIKTLEGFETLRKCPTNNCAKEISDNALQELLTREQFNRYSEFEIKRQLDLTQCIRCRTSFEPLENRRVRCINPECNFEFCKECNEVYHENPNCKEIFIEKRFNEIEQLVGAASQCPGCKLPYAKDDSCDHVKCTNQDCLIEFCFECACIRSPTMAHGNHYHREQCKNYFKPPDVIKHPDSKDVKSEKCSECQRLGDLCKPPPNLAQQRRLDTA